MPRTTIEAEPTPVKISTESTALLVIDMQRDFLERGGYGEALGNNPDMLRTVIEPLQRLLQAVRRQTMTVIYTREGHLPDLSDCPKTKLNRWPEGRRIGDPGPMGRILVRGEAGHEIIDDVMPMADEIVIDKPGKNAFYATNLLQTLVNGQKANLLVAGVTTEVCCASTIAAANDYGFNAIAVGDCMASYDIARHRAALNIIKAQGGIFGWVTDSEKVMRALRLTPH